MTTHPSKSSGTSQCAAIARVLKAKPCEWVSLPALHDASGSYVIHSRIADLRKTGMTISNKTERFGGKAMSFYMYIPEHETFSREEPPHGAPGETQHIAHNNTVRPSTNSSRD